MEKITTAIITYDFESGKVCFNLSLLNVDFKESKEILLKMQTEFKWQIENERVCPYFTKQDILAK